MSKAKEEVVNATATLTDGDVRVTVAPGRADPSFGYGTYRGGLFTHAQARALRDALNAVQLDVPRE